MSTNRNTVKTVNWSNFVRSRDNYVCQHCFKKVRGKNCHAHHIKSWAEFPKLGYNIDNGITLCKKCHRKVHQKVKIFK